MNKPFCSNLQDWVFAALAAFALSFIILTGCAPAVPSPSPAVTEHQTQAAIARVAVL